jgi:hypothetical protein
MASGPVVEPGGAIDDAGIEMPRAECRALGVEVADREVGLGKSRAEMAQHPPMPAAEIEDVDDVVRGDPGRLQRQENRPQPGAAGREIMLAIAVEHRVVRADVLDQPPGHRHHRVSIIAVASASDQGTFNVGTGPKNPARPASKPQDSPPRPKRLLPR